MAVMRVEKTNNYTVMSNYHLRDQRLSLKAKGLLSVMLSLPVEWDFTLFGLSRISKEGIDAIRAAVNELMKAGYIVRTRVRNAAGQLGDTEYTIYELPQDDQQEAIPPAVAASDVYQDDANETPALENPTSEKPMLENPTLDNPTSGKPTLGFPMLENPTQLNTNRINTESEKKDISNTDVSNPYQSGIYPSVPEATETCESDNLRHEPADSIDSIDVSSRACSFTSLPQAQGSSAVHIGPPERLTVQQLYTTEETGIPGMRRRLSYDALIRKVKRQIDYWDLMDGNNKDEVEDILSIMVEVLSAQCEFFTISGRKYPADLVHQRYSQINSQHVEYVLECFHKCGSDIKNIKQYLIAALFNAPATYNSYYSAAVRRDFEWLRH